MPVLAIVDGDDPALLGLLDADVTLTLVLTDDPAQVKVTVAERDLGTIGSAYLCRDLLHARFLDAGGTPAIPTAGDQPARLLGSAVERELAEAALPYTSGARQGLPAAVTHVLAALRTALADGDRMPWTNSGRRSLSSLRRRPTCRTPARDAGSPPR